jgi:hypothetical protein
VRLLRIASRHLLLILGVIAIAVAIASISETAFAFVFVLPSMLLVIAGPAVFAVEAVSDLRRPWQRVAGAVLLASAVVAAFAVLGVTLLWPGIAIALLMSLFLEWRRSRAQPES